MRIGKGEGENRYQNSDTGMQSVVSRNDGTTILLAPVAQVPFSISFRVSHLQLECPTITPATVEGIFRELGAIPYRVVSHPGTTRDETAQLYGGGESGEGGRVTGR